MKFDSAIALAFSEMPCLMYSDVPSMGVMSEVGNFRNRGWRIVHIFIQLQV